MNKFNSFKILIIIFVIGIFFFPSNLIGVVQKKGKKKGCGTMFDKNQLAWDSFAQGYDSMVRNEGDINHRLIINPEIVNLLGNIEEKIVLDAACGQGYFARILARKKAKLFGVDFSAEMIKLAENEEREAPLGIQYAQRDLREALDFPENFFDVVIFNMALMNVEDIDRAIKNTTEPLKDRGVFIFSILHPSFINNNAGWIIDHDYLTGRQRNLYYKIDNYFNDSVSASAWGGMQEPIFNYHRTLETYTRVLKANGLFISDIIEPKVNDQYLKELKENDPVWVVNDRIPFYLLVKAVKFSEKQ